MLLNLPVDIQKLVINNLECKDVYYLLLTNSIFNNEFGKKKFKEKYRNIIFLKKYLNKNYDKFKYLIKYVEKKDLDMIFILALNNIQTVWSDQVCGFFDMKYIFECIFHGCHINNIDLLKRNGLHFYKYFYDDIVKTIVEDDREKTQYNIDNCKKLKALHSNFIPFNK